MRIFQTVRKRVIFVLYDNNYKTQTLEGINFEFIMTEMYNTKCRSAIKLRLGPSCSKVGSAIHRINHYPLDSAIGFPNNYPLDSDLYSG